MEYSSIIKIEEKIKNVESELVVLRKEVEDKKAELRKLHDPCPTCGRSDKQTVSSTPAVWIYPTVYPIYSNQYYCYACNIWHLNGYVCNTQVPWIVNGVSYTIINSNLDILDTTYLALD